MGELELATLCRKAIEKKHKPPASLTHCVTEVLRASLSKMVQNGISAANSSRLATIAGAGGDSGASVFAQMALVATSTDAALVPVSTIAGAGGDLVGSVVGQDAVDVLKLSAPSAEGRKVRDTVSQASLVGGWGQTEESVAFQGRRLQDHRRFREMVCFKYVCLACSCRI